MFKLTDLKLTGIFFGLSWAGIWIISALTNSGPSWLEPLCITGILTGLLLCSSLFKDKED
jgi:hypothetical protein